MKKLSDIISSMADGIQNGLISQRGLFERTLSEIFLFEEKQQSKAKVVLEETISILLNITEQYGLSTVAARSISERSSEISRSTEEIVTAVQFHDITNQHLGAVKKALGYTHKSCLDILDGRGCTLNDENALQNFVARLGDFCSRQSGRLEHIRETFITAVEGIAHNLRNIGVNVEDISRDIQKITGDNGINRKPFISEMEGMLISVKESFTVITENAETSGKLMDTMLSLSGNVKEEIKKFITDIEEIAFNIKLVAFNTEIKSSQIGTEGFALEVVAERIKQLSDATSSQTGTISEMIGIITASADELSSGITAEVAGSSDEVAKISVQLEILELTFSGLSKNIVPLFAEIDKNTRDLSWDIEGLTRSMNVHKVLDEGVKKAVAELNGISSYAQAMLPGGINPEGVWYVHAKQASSQIPFENSEAELFDGMKAITECRLIADYDIHERTFNKKENSAELF